MAKWIFQKPGTWEYPTLGIRATTDDIYEADFAPDSHWSATDPAAVETVTHLGTPIQVPNFHEPVDGAPMLYDVPTHSFEVGTDSLAALVDAGLDSVRPDNGGKPVGKGELLFNVRDYGAKGDGATDDVTAINAAVTACNTSGGGTVLIPPSVGNYMLGSQILLKSNVRLQIAGNLKMLSTATTMAIQGTNRVNVIVEGLAGGGVIDMNRAQTVNGGSLTNQQGVYLSNTSGGVCSGYTVRGITVKNGWQRGIAINSSSGQALSNVLIERNTVIDVGADGIVFTGNGNPDRVTPSLNRNFIIRDNSVTFATVAGKAGIQVYGCSYVTITGNVLDGNALATGHGIVTGTAGLVQHVTDFQIARNIVKGFSAGGGGGTAQWGICLTVYAQRFGVTDNECIANYGGITADLEAGDSPGVEVNAAGHITGNRCLNSTGNHGINSRMLNNLTISNNRCTGGALGGIAVSNETSVTVTGNTCMNNVARGIGVFGNSGGNHYIANNYLKNNAGGDYYVDPACPNPIYPFLNVLNVKDFGARGDGATNDTTAINAAVTAAGANGRVYFPQGVYAVSTSLTIGSVTLEGDGAATIKKTGTATANFLTISAGSVGTKIRGIKIDANNLVTGVIVNFAAGASSDITFENCTLANAPVAVGFRIRDGLSNVKVRHCTIDGIDIGFYSDGASSLLTFEHNRIKNWVTRGFYTVGTATLAPSDVTLIYNRITDMATGGTVRQPIVFEGVDSNLLYRIKVNHNTVIGPGKAWTAADPGTADQISLHRCADFEVIGNFSTLGGDGGMAIGGNSIRGVVEGNVCTKNDVTGVFLGSSTSSLTSTTVSGNTFMNNGQNRNGDRNDVGRTGIRAYDTTDCVITGNVLGDDQAVKTQKYGVSMTECSGIALGTNRDTGNALGLYNVDGSANVNIAGATKPALMTTPVAVSNTTTNTPAWTPPALPAGTFVVGSAFDLDLSGTIDCKATSGNFTGRILVGSTVVATFTAAASQTNANTNLNWRVNLRLVVEAVGSSGVVSVAGTVTALAAAGTTWTTTAIGSYGTTTNLATSLAPQVQLAMGTADPANINRLNRATLRQVA